MKTCRSYISNLANDIIAKIYTEGHRDIENVKISLKNHSGSAEIRQIRRDI